MLLITAFKIFWHISYTIAPAFYTSHLTHGIPSSTSLGQI
jgi:hypothetical protein